MKIIFLDFDGVLNSATFFAVRDATPAEFRTTFDPAAIARLQHIVDATGAAIVVSSTWRCGLGIDRLRDLLGRSGLHAHVADVTPSMQYEPREAEISAYLDGCEGYAWIAIDDLSLDVGEHLVQTDDRYGLQDEHVEAAIERLNRRDAW